MKRPVLPLPVRRWLYGVGVAAIPVLVYLDVMEAEAGALAIPLLVALLNLSDPATPSRPPQQP